MTFTLETIIVQNHKYCITGQDLTALDTMQLKHADLQFLTLILARNATMMPGTLCQVCMCLCVCVIFIRGLADFTITDCRLLVLSKRKVLI